MDKLARPKDVLLTWCAGVVAGSWKVSHSMEDKSLYRNQALETTTVAGFSSEFTRNPPEITTYQENQKFVISSSLPNPFSAYFP
ncbi:hypothetical protein L6164_006272 [Bauhinia variegata]|uniref:Uncharacterized protein n=1 Tax=Bauhinia variegata TaxID=167791 RepID=A0ACB9PT36_BAUVA|nr:hypothetical protein L6164_006272 [Bauhinia variegata]